MNPMTCWPALLTGLYRDYKELFTESGPFFFLSHKFLVFTLNVSFFCLFSTVCSSTDC